MDTALQSGASASIYEAFLSNRMKRSFAPSTVPHRIFGQGNGFESFRDHFARNVSWRDCSLAMLQSSLLASYKLHHQPTIYMDHFDPAFRMPERIDASPVKTVRSKIRSWITSSWMSDLVVMFGGAVPSADNLDESLERLETFSARWDFRRMARDRGAPTDDQLRQGAGSARWLSTATGLSEDQEVRIVEDATRLGLVHGQEPIFLSYEYVVVLGGARLSCQLRPLRAAEIVRSGVDVGRIALLGAARPVAESERDATDTYAPGATDEFDLIVAGAVQAFGFSASVFHEERHDDPDNRNLSWIVRHYDAVTAGRPLHIVAISAPSSDPLRRRANSADTLLFLIEREKIVRGSKLLLITSQIYVPYVQLEALRTVALPQHLLVETIGFPGDRMPPLQGLSNANHYLQETRSAIQAARRFCQAYPETN